MGSIYRRGDRDAVFYAAYVDGHGKRIRRSTKTSDRKAALSILAKWETDAAIRLAGVINPEDERLAGQGTRPIQIHLKEFEQSISASGNTEKHVSETMRILKLVVKDQQIQQLTDLRAENANRHAAKLKEIGRSARTIQRHLRALKQFTRWAVVDQRMRSDPLMAIKTPNPQSDRRLERRSLLPAEWPLLRDAAHNGPQLDAMDGPARSLLYELTLQTGLRQGEVRELTLGKLHLDTKHPFVLLPGAKTKNGKPARQYITTPLRNRLAIYAKTRTKRLFDLPDSTDVADIVRADLAAAREQWLEGMNEPDREEAEKKHFLTVDDPEGRVLDFHALRHTCGAWLAAQGEHPNVVKEIMRHSSIQLTMDTYGHLFPNSTADAIHRMDRYF